jgi:transcriptional regulator with XRE-family HTH domain
MTILQFMKKYKLTYRQFGDGIGMDQAQVHRYASGKAMPNRKSMLAIVQFTRGQVLPNDFYPLVEALEALKK